MNLTKSEYVSKMVEFWSGFLKSSNNLDDADFGNEQKTIEQFRSAYRRDVSDSQVELFRNKLTDLIKAEFDPDWAFDMEIDYDLDPLLKDACKFAGVSETNLPIKTFLQFDSSSIRVIVGYSGKWQTL